MKNRILVLNVNGSTNNQVVHLFKKIFNPEKYDVEFHDKIEYFKTDLRDVALIPIKYDILYFDGGEDVNPMYYGEVSHPKTYFNSERDTLEMSNYEIIKKHYPHTMCIGICRGAQMLTVLSGGKLFQHVNNHGTSHDIIVPSFDKQIVVTSTHHQMMNPFKLNEGDYRIIGYTKRPLSDVHENTAHGRIHSKVVNHIYTENFVEPEIVYYRKTNALCIQGHPEYSSASTQFVDLTKELILRQMSNLL